MATFSLRVCMLRDFALLVAGDCVAARFMECGARDATSEAGTRARALGRRLLHVRYTHELMPLHVDTCAGRYSR